MKLPYRISEAGSKLYRAGVSYHAYGTIKQGTKALFNYFKADNITDSQIVALREYCPDMQVTGMRSEYAPELRSVCIMFPKAAWYRAQVTN